MTLVDSNDDLVGRALDELGTPALLLDLNTARRNIAAMAARIEEMGASLRPHIKVHKCPPLARMQVDAGAVGICVATAWEALAMAQEGLPDVFVANEVWGRPKQAALMEASRLATST